MKVCNNCEKEYSDDMNYCELCGEKLEDKIPEEVISLENLKEEKEIVKEKLDVITNGDKELEGFVDEMYSIENREVLKHLLALTGAEWLSKDKDFMKDVMVKFADFKAKKNNQTVY